jgi:diketogulonate reductase-like aldo/keto reductase
MKIPLNLSLLLPLGTTLLFSGCYTLKQGAATLGYLPLSKPVTPERIQENAGMFDFGLPREDVKALAGLTGIAGTSASPDETDY